MQRFLVILVLLVIVASWFGCGRNSNNANNINLQSTPDKAEQIIKERQAANANSQRK